jgi:hypothetical protein
MPVTRVYVIECDTSECSEQICYGTGCDGAKARRLARGRGWTVGRKVTCPKCIAKAKSPALTLSAAENVP